MKKIIFLTVLVLFAASLSGCREAVVQESSTENAPPQSTEDTLVNDEATENIPETDGSGDTPKATDTEAIEDSDGDADGEKTEDIVLPEVIFDESDGIFVMNTGGVDISKATLSYYIFSAKRSYPEAGGDIITEKAILELKQDVATEILADNLGVSLSEEERREKIDKVIFDTVNSYENTPEVSYTQALSYVRMTDTVFRQLRENTVLQELIYEKCYAPGSGGEHITDEKIVEYANADYARIKHILIPTADLDEEMKAQAKRDAKEILSMTSDTPFEELIEVYSSDSRMNIDTGYYLTAGSTVPEIWERAFEMEIGNVSDIVESAYGYHIIKRYPIDGNQILADTKIRTELSEEICKKVFWDDLSQIADSLYTQYYENYASVVDELLYTL